MVEIGKLFDSPLFEPARKAKRVNILVAILLPPFIFIAMQLIGGIAGRAVTGSLDTSSPLMAGLVQNVHYVVSFGLIILFVFAWVAFIEKRKISTIGLMPGKGLKKYIIGMALCAIVFTLAVGLQVITGNAAVTLNPSGTSAMVIAGIAFAFIGFIVQGSAEEIMFRGWQIPVIGARYGPLAGILISSVVFGLLHIIAGATLLEIIIITIAGIFFALYAIREGDIWGPCGFHAVWNWLSGNVIVQNGYVETPSLVLFNLQATGPYIDAIYGLVYVAGITVILAISIIKLNKKVRADSVKG
jgi:membrane protease YdiL (CAAX protease family)